MEPAEQVVHPFGIDPLSTSRLFMHGDLAKSGLTVDDFPIPPVPLAAVQGRGCYQIWYNDVYYKLKIDRELDKYVGLKGVVPPVVVFGEHYQAPITASVEGYKKALSFYVTTGIPTLCIDSCWGFGENVTDEAGVKVKDLHTDIIKQLMPGQSHLVLFDGDWSTNDNVRLALATYKMLLEEQGVKLRCKDLGANELGKRLGYDDWFVEHYGIDRALWPDRTAILSTLVQDVKDIPLAAILGGANSFALRRPERFTREYMDFSDRGTGALLIKLLGEDNLKFCQDTKTWIHWTAQGRWRDVGDMPYSLVDHAALYYLNRAEVLTAQAAKVEGTAIADKGPGLLDQAKHLRNWATKHCSSTIGRGLVLKDMSKRPELIIMKDSFDSNPDLLAAQNGIIDLRTGELRTEVQEDRVLRRLPDPYSETEPTGEAVDRIKKFLVEITSVSHGVPDPHALNYLQRRLGASIRGRNTLTSIELWNGYGANGKSVLSNIIQAALGDTDIGGYACSTNAGVIMSAARTRDAESSTPFLIKLLGARLVFMAESKDTDHMNESLVKQITGGDRIAARGNYQDGQTYTATYTPVLLTNSLPSISEGGEALWDRIAVTEFSCRWRRPNKMLVSDADKLLPLGDQWFEDKPSRILEVRQWIVWWLVQGSVLWEKDGLGLPPQRNVVAVEHYQSTNDRYTDWMVERNWVFAEGVNTRSSDVYRSFTDYIQAAGGHAPNNKVFTKRLLERFPDKLSAKRSNGYSVISGICLKDKL